MNLQSVIPMKSAADSASARQLQRALAVDPKVLICDEATSALDVTIQKQIMELLEELKEKHGLSFHFYLSQSGFGSDVLRQSTGFV